jgi:dTDP-4-amino-4,6-dideoxygalactose transaminase
LFGNNANMRGIFKYAHANKHIIIEDCAQSTGSGSGVTGDFSVFSFYPTKPLGTMGDGGAICTDDLEAYEELKKLRFYGLSSPSGGGGLGEVGINSRMGELEAAVLNAKLDRFEELGAKRLQIAARYKKIITGMRINSNCVYHQFPVLFNDREEIIKVLKDYGIPFMIHYHHHVSELPVFTPRNPSPEGGGREGVVGFRVNDKIISLPIHPFMHEDHIQMVEEFLHTVKRYEYEG